MMRALALSLCFFSLCPVSRAEGLQTLFACLEQKNATLISAHRGGPAPGFPENALETLERGYTQGVRLFEIDVVTAADGTLYLMHDRTLDRTTTGTGPVEALDWPRIASLNLKDNNGEQTAFHPPRLEEVLNWAVEAKAYLSLDIKGETRIDALTTAVQAAQAVPHVLYLAGDLDRAGTIAAMQPEAMLSVSINERQTIDDITASDLNAKQLVLWTGFRRFDAFAIALLDARGFFTSFGTLGFGNSYDDQIKASGYENIYANLADTGLHVIATDRPLAARQALMAADQAWDSAPSCPPSA